MSDNTEMTTCDATGTCGTEACSTKHATVEVNDRNFEEAVMRSEKPVLVDFWAQWCPPCRAAAPMLEELAAEMGEKIIIAKMNVEDSPIYSSKAGITQIPAFKVYKDGKVVAARVGALPKAAMKQWVEAVL